MRRQTENYLGGALFALLILSSLGSASPQGRGNNQKQGRESDITVQTPRRGATLNTSSVTISGIAKVNMLRVSIYDKAKRRVYNQSVPVQNGQWSAQTTLRNGSYRLSVDSSRSKDNDSIAFKVNQDGGSVPGTENEIVVGAPARGSVVAGPYVTISGTSTKATLRVGVYNSAHKRVFNKSVVARNGRWSTVAHLVNGSYRLVVDSRGETDRDAIAFQVSGSGVESNITVISPRNNSTIGRDVAINGTSRLATIRVGIYDSANTRVFNKSLTVMNGRWSTSTRLPAGTYRLTVDTHNRSDADVVRFVVRG